MKDSHKIEQLPPAEHSQLLKSNLSDRYFGVKEDEYSKLKQIKAVVQQGSVFGPVLYLLHTSDLPQPEETTVATFADYIAIWHVGDSVEEAAEKLQRAVDKVNNWTRKWLIKPNEAKSVHVDFINKRSQHIPITINDKVIPHSNTAKYLGMTLGAKVRWRHMSRKKNANSLDQNSKEMYLAHSKKIGLSIHNKLMLHKY